MINALKNGYYSFPFQLLMLSFKRHQLLLFLWVFLWVVVVGKFGVHFGVPAVFLDPEYLGKVGYLSFSIVGLSFGAMYVTWNIVLYILHSHRFPFMASLQYPLTMFFVNNAILPLAFLIPYIGIVIHHQTVNEFQPLGKVLFGLVGFVAGFLLSLLITALYFNLANKAAKNIMQNGETPGAHHDPFDKVPGQDIGEVCRHIRVDYYITSHLSIRPTRTVEHYPLALQQLVFRRHHLNAFFAFIIAFLLLAGIGFFMENPFFQIPIAASGFLFLSIIISLFGMFLYWTGSWGTIAIIVFIIAANHLTKYDLFGSQSRAYGLNYNTEKATYNLETLNVLASDSNIAHDENYFLPILENWKKKNTDPRHPDRKPIMYFINVSGGGLRSALFATAVLQRLDSLMGGTLFNKTFLISGASGGMMGVTYLREEFMRQQDGFNANIQDPSLPHKVTQDLLNPVALTILSNDALLPYHKFKLDSFVYSVDRGYSFERAFCQNTGMRFDKTIDDYRQAEYDARIPLIIYHTAIMNDSRRYFISPQPVSFLMRPLGSKDQRNPADVDAVDFCRFFKKQGGKHLLVSSALRMNATFPFILPNPVLPSEPPTYVMDGGALDNFGTETTLRFLQAFEDWINANTSGVIIIQIRDTKKAAEPEEAKQKTLVARLTDPLGVVYSNMGNIQDFLANYRLDDQNKALNGKLHTLLFEYTSANKDDLAAMSFHLTSRDRKNIIRSLRLPENEQSFKDAQKY